jgi:dolichol-phosphate mannosyltransferase|uniref:Glycosyltransferase family 2 protein n=1 Tax=candidate division WOR-3 bacterium TaxID=2052148 RepID=A0A7C3Z1U4_UNCW3
MKLSVIIPVYNEKNTLEKIISLVEMVPIDKEIIVVDDFSNDGTREILKKWEGKENLKILYHSQNAGKGSAIRTGIAEAKGEIIVIQDADLEYNPYDYLKMLKLFSQPEVKAVYGSRFKGKGRFLRRSKLANLFLSFLTSLLFNERITDMETCYKMIRREVFQDLKLKAKRFEIEPEITAKLLKKGIKIYEVPISYSGRKEGKKIKAKDGFVALRTLFFWRLK